jgi:hypothetical protein
MTEPRTPNCPECLDTPETNLDRRHFVRLLGGVALGATLGVPRLFGADKPAAAKPAEALIQELASTLTAEQKKTVLLPFDHGGKNPTRLGMHNAAIGGNSLAKVYTKGQQELVEKILKAILNGEEGLKIISRNNTWDNSKTFDGCGAHLFGEPGTDKPYAFLFTGHHLTLRADGNFKDGLAWGGPIYYGHSANGHAATNAYNYQTKSVTTVFKALKAEQQKKAVVGGDPGDSAESLKMTKAGHPGIAAADLDAEQKALVEKAMRDILLPYRKEDVEEVMTLIKTNGGMDKLHLAFYRDAGATEGERWHAWRIEGPGFVWNYRVLPHVHCRVLIARS